MATTAAMPPLHNETTMVDHGQPHHANYAADHDLEKQMNGGAPLGRQFSVQLTAEQFERLYLQPGGTAAKGDLAKRFANPTPLGVASFLLCLTPFSCHLMGWAGSTTAAAVAQVGPYYFIGGIGLYLAGLLEWIIGNTFPATVFMTFGGFWLSFAFLLQPTQGIAEALNSTAAPLEYNAGVGIYLVWWACITLIYLIASLRTNVVFVLLFLFLDIAFWLLVALYMKLAQNSLGGVPMILKAAGAFGFLCACCGWYLLVVLLFGSTGVPVALPVGDLSNFMTRRKARQE